MNRRQLLKTLAALSCVGVTNEVTGRALGGALSAPASIRVNSLLEALMSSRSQCIELLAALPSSTHSASELAPAVEELRCLTDHAILVCRTKRQQSPAFLQASSDSINRVCRFLSQSDVPHNICGITVAEAVSSLQRTSDLLTHAIMA